jgi:peptidoglycan/xylan/chitin deacetylase (PgdA/CDA1 family)
MAVNCFHSVFSSHFQPHPQRFFSRHDVDRQVLRIVKAHRLAILLALLAIQFGAHAEIIKPVQADPSIRAGGSVRGAVGQKKIALAFTGHSFAEGGATFLGELGRRKAKASFFFTGEFLANTNFELLVRRIIAEGHYVGPHSDKHLLYCNWDKMEKTLVTRDDFRADLNANLQKIERFGVSRASVKFFLPPFEQYNQDIAAWSAEMGLTLVNFTPGTRSNADYTGEAETNFVSSQAIFDSIVKRERDDPHGLNGFILLFHIGSGPGRADKFHARFGELLDYLSGKGYKFVHVDELLEPKQEHGNQKAD